MRRARLALLLAAILAGGVVAVALAFERDEPDGARPRARQRPSANGAPLAPAGLERTEVAAARIGRSIYVVGGFEKRTGLTTRRARALRHPHEPLAAAATRCRSA